MEQEEVVDGAGSRPVRERIFLADDDELMRESIAAALAEDGYEVVGVDSGLELVECLEITARDGLRAPDLIVMDIYMPDATGIEVLERLRAEGWTTPVVLMTAFSSFDERTRTRAAGRATLIEKPFGVSELRAAARSARATPAQ